jgi:hypothetical protein
MSKNVSILDCGKIGVIPSPGTTVFVIVTCHNKYYDIKLSYI